MRLELEDTDPRRLSTVVDVVTTSTMPSAFVLDDAASVRPIESGYIPRSYECHLYRCV